MRLRTIRSAFSARFASILFASLVGLAWETAPAYAQSSCTGVPPGGPCKNIPDPIPGDCLEPRCIENHCEVNHPSPGGTPCDDGDGNVCTSGACIQGVGKCGPGEPAPNGTACPDSDKNPCTVAGCQGGQCVQDLSPATLPMNDVASVAADARPLRVHQDEAYVDCGACCEPQSLEALRPTPNGPDRKEPDGGLPLRTKYCGTVVRYGVNNENGDARDIMMNIEPNPGFEHFLAGYVNTECTPLTSEQEDLFAKKDSECPVSQCLAAANGACKARQCIHAEITPADQFYGQDARFLPIINVVPFPCRNGWDCNSALEPALKWKGGPPPGGQAGQEGRKVCVYGVYAHDHGPDHRVDEHHELCCSRDASHDRPEIHPFDAVWFLHPSGLPGWMFGVFQDDSNRYSFPHCDSDHNGNTWSQGPRDLTFRFPFRFPRSQTPLKACLRHTVTTSFTSGDHAVAPINVTTKLMPDPLVEIKTLKEGSLTLLEAVEPAGLEEETQVRIEGCVTPTEIMGFIKLRVAVGCPQGSSCPGLPDSDDPGSGFYYAELTFQRDCSGGGVL